MEPTLVEPSDDLAKHPAARFEALVPTSNLKILHSSLEDLTSDDSFDVILMSHMFYHLSRALWGKQLAKALSLLRPDGRLLVVLREKDDAYDFKMAFKPRLFDASFKALTIDDILNALQ